MIDPMSMARVSYEDVVEKWGATPEKLGDILALAGDTADNVPGVPGIGPKIAAALIQDFGSLDNLLENLDEVKQKGRREKLQANTHQAILSRRLVELDRNVPMEEMSWPEGTSQVSDLRMELMDSDGLLSFFENMGLKDLKRRFEYRLQQQRGYSGQKPKASAEKVPTTKPLPPPMRRTSFRKPPKATAPKPEDFKDVPF